MPICVFYSSWKLKISFFFGVCFALVLTPMTGSESDFLYFSALTSRVSVDVKANELFSMFPEESFC